MIPKNWSFVQLGSVAKSQYGYTAKAIDDKSLPKMLRITDIQNGKVDWENVPNCQIDGELLKKYLLQDGDIVIARTGATTGKSYLLNNPINSVFASYLIRLRSSKNLNVKYLYYFLQSNSYWNQISELAVGIAQPGVNSSKLQRINFPLPPFDEQQRIVDIIENLFSKLNRAKALAQNIIDNYELRRSAILHKAFTGILTSNWRFNNKIDFDSWQNLLIKNIASIGSGGTPSRKNIKYYNGNIAWVKTGEIYWNKITKTEEYITLEALENSSARIYPVGTVLVAMYGQGLTRGRAAILGIESATNQAVCALQPLDNINNKFLYYFFMANYHNFRTKAFGTNQSNYSATVIGKLNINIPTIKEQKEIVRILDSLLAKEQRTKELAEQILQKIDLMKKSILARAFRGALMTNTSNL